MLTTPDNPSSPQAPMQEVIQSAQPPEGEEVTTDNMQAPNPDDSLRSIIKETLLKDDEDTAQIVLEVFQTP